jgi:hypothetical protein
MEGDEAKCGGPFVTPSDQADGLSDQITELLNEWLAIPDADGLALLAGILRPLQEVIASASEHVPNMPREVVALRLAVDLCLAKLEAKL